MFRLFKKKTKKVRVMKCNQYISLKEVEGIENCYNIVISPILEDFRCRVRKVLNQLNIYDDKVWIEAYKEYFDNYKVYDVVPDLLLYKIPVFFSMSYPGIEDHTDKDFAFEFYIPDTSYYESLPEEFKLNQLFEDSFKSMYQRVYPYLPDTKLSVDDYIKVIRFNYCKNWDILRKHPKSIGNYFDECMDIIMSFTDEDCLVTVNNIIERCAEELKEKLQTLKNQINEQ